MTHQVRIEAIKPLAHNVYQYDLEKPGGLEFQPGQATELAIARMDGAMRNAPSPLPHGLVFEE